MDHQLARSRSGNGCYVYSGDGGPATQAALCDPGAVAVDSSGNIYIADGSNRIRKVDTSGIITSVAGNGQYGYSGDGGPATQAALYCPNGVAVDSTGNIYILDSENNRIRLVDTSGIINTVAGNGVSSYSGDGGPATQAALYWPSCVAVDSSGNIYIADESNRIRKVSFSGAMRSSIANGDVIVSDKNGMGYIMTCTGLHKSTIDLATGKTLLTFEYDQANQLASITDRFGNQTTLQKNGNGVPVSITSPYGHVTSLAINADHRLEKVTYQDNSFYSFNYSSFGLMTDEHDPAGNYFIHQFDVNGKIISVSDPEGGAWNYTRSYDAAGNAKTDMLTAEGNLTQSMVHTDSTGAYTSLITYPSGSTKTTTGSADGLTKTIQAPCGMKITKQYDLDPVYQYKYTKGNTTASPAGLTKTVTVDKVYQDTNADNIPDKITETVKLNGRAWTSINDTLAGATTITSPLGKAATVNYDPAKLLTQSITVPGLNPVSYGYDSLGRRTSIVSGSRTASIGYDGSNNVDHITTPDGKTFSFTYDAMGRTTSKTLPDNKVISFNYDNNSNMTVLTNPNNTGFNFDYNGVNLRKTMTMPLSGSYQYSYDKERKLISILFPSGKQIENTYTNGLLSSTLTPEGTTNYTYNCSSLLAEAIKGTEKINYAYDGSLLKTDTRSGLMNNAIGYTYNNDFKISSISYAEATQALTYDNDGLLTKVGSYTITRDAQNGLPVSVTDGTLTTTRTFSGYGETDGNASSIGGAPKYNYTLTRDLAGRIIQKIETVGGATDTNDYAYDDNGRLKEVKKNGSVTENYTYDANGNRLTDGLWTYSYSNEDHLITAGSDRYQFDADGFLTNKTSGTATTTYQYSSRGELLSAVLPGGTVITYDHDPIGRRITKRVNGAVTEKYLWKGATTLLAVYDGGDNLLMRFNYADSRLPVSMVKSGIIYYLVYDQIGTLRAVTDTTGNIVKQIDYNSFGNIIADTNPSVTVPLGFAGGLHDRDTNLVRFGARDYDPSIGRWTAKDPIDFAGGDTNLYGYVLNNPINWIDPRGLDNPSNGPYGTWSKKCVGKARIREGNPTFQDENSIGAFGIGVQDGLAIIPSQWGWTSKKQVRPYLNKIHGTLSNGTSIFDAITDIQDNRDFGTTAQAQQKIIADSGGNLVIEIYGQPDLGLQDVVIYVPPNVDCPCGTEE